MPESRTLWPEAAVHYLASLSGHSRTVLENLSVVHWVDRPLFEYLYSSGSGRNILDLEFDEATRLPVLRRINHSETGEPRYSVVPTIRQIILAEMTSRSTEILTATSRMAAAYLHRPMEGLHLQDVGAVIDELAYLVVADPAETVQRTAVFGRLAIRAGWLEAAARAAEAPDTWPVRFLGHETVKPICCLLSALVEAVLGQNLGEYGGMRLLRDTLEEYSDFPTKAERQLLALARQALRNSPMPINNSWLYSERQETEHNRPSLTRQQNVPRAAPQPLPHLDEARIHDIADHEIQSGRLSSVAVLDSGVSAHWYLDNRTYPVGPPDLGDERWDLSSAVLPRVVGHGTAVAGIVREYSAHTAILSRRVIDRDGVSHDELLATAILDLIRYSPDVLNLSVGPGHHERRPDMVTATPLTAAAITRLQEACGTIVVLAAGYRDERWPQELLTTPGERTVIVGALDKHLRKAEFSDDRDVQLWARGVDVLAPFVYWTGRIQLGTTAEDGGQPVPQPSPVETFAGWTEWTGTSFAAPAVAGAVAAAISADTDTRDVRERRLHGLHKVLKRAIHFNGLPVLNATPSLNRLYTTPIVLPPGEH
jgi:Subtilase family